MSDIYGSQLPPWLQGGQGMQGPTGINRSFPGPLGQLGNLLSALRGGQSPAAALSAFTGSSAPPAGGSNGPIGPWDPTGAGLPAGGSNGPTGPWSPTGPGAGLPAGGPTGIQSGTPGVGDAGVPGANAVPGFGTAAPSMPPGDMGSALFSPPPMAGGVGGVGGPSNQMGGGPLGLSTGLGGGPGNSMPGFGR